MIGEVEKMEKLTDVEEIIMRCIWEYGEEMPFLQLGKELKEKYQRDYKRTSIRTYLFRLEEKGYLTVEKRGRQSYIRTLIAVDDYKREQAGALLDVWFSGSAKEFLSALGGRLSEEEGRELKGILNDMDFD